MKIQDLNQESAIDSGDMRNTVGGTSNGISALIQVTQLKSQFANEEALDGSDKQPQPKPDPKKKASISPYALRTNAGAWAGFAGGYSYYR